MAELVRLENSIREHFAPQLRADGFAGSGRTFRRARDGWVHVLTVQSSRWGGQFAINLGLQPLAVPDVLGNPADPKKITESLCEFRRRLSSSESDKWWSHEPTQDSMNEAVKAATLMYLETGRSLFSRITGTGAPFDSVTPEAFAKGDFNFAGFGSTAIRMALVLARLRASQGRKSDSIAFASIGLAGVGSAVGLRREFEALAAQR